MPVASLVSRMTCQEICCTWCAPGRLPRNVLHVSLMHRTVIWPGFGCKVHVLSIRRAQRFNDRDDIQHDGTPAVQPESYAACLSFCGMSHTCKCMHRCRLMHQSRQDMGSTGMAAQCSTTKQALW